MILMIAEDSFVQKTRFDLQRVKVIVLADDWKNSDSEGVGEKICLIRGGSGRGRTAGSLRMHPCRGMEGVGTVLLE